MYTDLDKVDIATTDKQTGRATAHQTDHRRQDEIDAELDLSVVFALTRVINGRRILSEDDKPVDVYYVSLDTPPERLVDAVHAAGGRVRLGAGDELVEHRAASADATTLGDRAFAAVAAQVRDRLGGTAFDEALLKKLEAEILDDGVLDEEEDGKMSYWTRLIELSAVAGEVLRTLHGGRWVQSDQYTGVVPFLFEVGTSKFNVANKAHSFLKEGADESLTYLLRAVGDGPVVSDVLLVAFKPGGWPGEKECVCQPILKMAPAGVSMPLMVYGYDQPNSFAHLNREKETELAADLEALHKKAVANLASVTDIEVKDFEVGPLKLVAVSGNYFAAEKILDAPFMRSIGRRIGSPLLAAGIPKKGLLLVMNGAVQPEQMDRFMAICAGYHRDGGDRALTPVPFIVGEEGDVQGVIIVGERPPESQKKKGFFSRLFGNN